MELFARTRRSSGPTCSSLEHTRRTWDDRLEPGSDPARGGAGGGRTQFSALWIATQPVRAWLELLQPLGVPIGPINDLAQVWDEPQVNARGMKIHVSHPLCDRLPLVGSPMKLSVTPPIAAIAPPTLGQHTDQVLREHLGMSDVELAELRSDSVIG